MLKNSLQQIRLRGFFVVGQAEMLIGQPGGETAAGGSFQETQLHEVGLVDIRDGVRFLADRGGDSVQSHRSAIKLVDDSMQHLVVYLIKSYGVNLKLGQCRHGRPFN